MTEFVLTDASLNLEPSVLVAALACFGTLFFAAVNVPRFSSVVAIVASMAGFVLVAHVTYSPAYAAHRQNVETVELWLKETGLKTSSTSVQEIALKQSGTFTLGDSENRLIGYWVGDQFEVSGTEVDGDSPLIWMDKQVE